MEQSDDNQQQQTKEKYLSKSQFKEWIMNEFPQLFNGYHFWLVDTVKSVTKKEPETKSEKQIISAKYELSSLMNNFVLWHLLSNLPVCYTKSLASDNCTIIEKIENALLVRSL